MYTKELSNLEEQRDKLLDLQGILNSLNHFRQIHKSVQTRQRKEQKLV